MTLKQLLYCLPMIVLAFGNATLRELVFVKYYSEFRAHQLSTLTLIVLCGIYIWAVLPLLHLQSGKQAWLMGLVWVLLTMAFEFSLGRLTGKSWSFLLRDYNLLEGRLWLLFLACLLVFPWLFYWMRNK